MYYNSPRLSNSTLSAIQVPRLLKLKKENPKLEEDSVSLRVGSALDCLLTSPSRWDADFRVLNVNKPYGLMGKFVENLPAGIKIDSPPLVFEEAY